VKGLILISRVKPLTGKVPNRGVSESSTCKDNGGDLGNAKRNLYEGSCTLRPGSASQTCKRLILGTNFRVDFLNSVFFSYFEGGLILFGKNRFSQRSMKRTRF